MRVLVTGGAGFIGSHVVSMLCDRGDDVVVVDDLSFGHREFVDQRARLLTASFDDAATLDAALPSVDVVMHLAASSIIRFAFDRPVEYFQNNLMRGVLL